ncbi:MAG: aminoacyl-tRNA hydrolase, partial [bacterium]|nr:aminoacyl-tRNA hydrolase [bacterium]
MLFKILIGLGNKDQQYRLTRHNLGFFFLDFLQKTLHLPAWRMKPSWNSLVSTNSSITLVKPQTYMNLSGQIIRKIYQNLSDDVKNQTLIIHDDLDIPFGKYKLVFAKGPKQHNGVLSIEQALGTKEFWRLRIGIDNRTNQQPTAGGSDYVLSPFTPEELRLLTSQILPSILTNLKPHLP